MFIAVPGIPSRLGAAANEPRHKGKTLSEWIALMNKKPPGHRAALTLGELEEVAIPTLITAMRSHPEGAIGWLSHVALAKVR